MHISKISFRMNIEVAPYKHEHVEVTVDVGSKDDPDQAFAYAKNSARSFLGIDVNEDDVAEAEKVLVAAKRAGLRK